mmetsp:Transcript_4045/g.5284  ORF Transcript_4045/g.5284 Transcript_4045/m.5284 type:complete len:875 (+) Transcript_4045:151-2775(+)|eukprot:CAMPEP_0117861242 /NCGR_PEP_ID=MMETSP0950-20121206/4258_1 /TAXON_ID=44440 /ORGANISM="Chattonella subsalsa, Strain CCMP2191" /LENGTH=874 /DNA_ID=CAMNT_0005711561 /DNA_START=122 /DNA_END=2746 /DNA_ORIENTATION=+
MATVLGTLPSWGYPAVGPMRDLKFPQLLPHTDRSEAEGGSGTSAGETTGSSKVPEGQGVTPASLPGQSTGPATPAGGEAGYTGGETAKGASGVIMGPKPAPTITPGAPQAAKFTVKVKKHPLLAVEFPLGDAGELFRSQVEWVPSQKGEYPQPEDYAQELGLSFGLPLEAISELATYMRDQLEHPPSSEGGASRRGSAAKSASRRSSLWEPSTRKPPRARQSEKKVVYVDPANTITRADVTDEMRQQVLDKLRAEQEAIKIPAKRFKNINCHICHNRKETCYRCCPLGLHNHSYCSNHMKLRWNLTEAMLKEDPWCFSICPPCTLTCPCSACQRKLDAQAANCRGLNLRDDMGRISTATGNCIKAVVAPAPADSPAGPKPPAETALAAVTPGGGSSSAVKQEDPGGPGRPATITAPPSGSVAVKAESPRPLPPRPVRLPSEEGEEEEEDQDEDGEDSDASPDDGNMEFCSICKTGGGLVCCDSCPRAFHLDPCLKLKEEDLPDGQWACPRCEKEEQQDFLGAVCPAEEDNREKGKTAVEMCEALVDFFVLHEFASVFLEPIDPEKMGLTDYEKLIKQPMDLGTIKKRLNAHYYRSAINIMTDLRLVWHNCKTYNKEGSAIWRMADHLSRLLERFYESRLAPQLTDMEKQELEAEERGFKAVTAMAFAKVTGQGVVVGRGEGANLHSPLFSGDSPRRKRTAPGGPGLRGPVPEEEAASSKTYSATKQRGWKYYYVEAAQAVLNGECKDLNEAIIMYKLKSQSKLQMVYEELSTGGASPEHESAATMKRTKQGKARVSGKRPKNSESGDADKAKKKAKKKAPKYEIGLKFKKLFPGYGKFTGEVIAYRRPYYKVRYEDGDEEDLSQKELDNFLAEK